MSCIDYALRDQVAWITWADGERGNPIHARSMSDLYAAVRRARDDQARVVVLGATGRFFSVGGDLREFAAADDLGRYVDDLAEAVHLVVSELLRLDAVVVSIVQGTAGGAGFPLAAAADVVIAAEDARFSLGYARVGLSVDGGTSMLVHTLGLHRVLRLALLHDQLTAHEAYEAGLVARVAPADDLAAVVDEVVGGLASGAHRALVSTKHLIRTAAEPHPESVMRAESVTIRQRAVEPDGREGIAAFVEKRPARFA